MINGNPLVINSLLTRHAKATPSDPKGGTYFDPIPPNPNKTRQIEVLTHVSNTPIMLTWLTHSAHIPPTANSPPGGVLAVLVTIRIQTSALTAIFRE